VSDEAKPLIFSNKEMTPEEEYFAKLEGEKLKLLREEAAGRMAEAEKEKLKQLHFMRCPKCGMALTEVDFQGLKLDRCFSCGGSWFDSGEVETLLEHQHTGIFSRMKKILG